MEAARLHHIPEAPTAVLVTACEWQESWNRGRCHVVLSGSLHKTGRRLDKSNRTKRPAFRAAVAVMPKTGNGFFWPLFVVAKRNKKVPRTLAAELSSSLYARPRFFVLCVATQRVEGRTAVNSGGDLEAGEVWNVSGSCAAVH
jgi:hypothetical protein